MQPPDCSGQAPCLARSSISHAVGSVSWRKGLRLRSEQSSEPYLLKLGVLGFSSSEFDLQRTFQAGLLLLLLVNLSQPELQGKER